MGVFVRLPFVSLNRLIDALGKDILNICVFLIHSQIRKQPANFILTNQTAFPVTVCVWNAE